MKEVVKNFYKAMLCGNGRVIKRELITFPFNGLIMYYFEVDTGKNIKRFLFI